LIQKPNRSAPGFVLFGDELAGGCGVSIEMRFLIDAERFASAAASRAPSSASRRWASYHG
jgi:hypothetical protein